MRRSESTLLQYLSNVEYGVGDEDSSPPASVVAVDEGQLETHGSTRDNRLDEKNKEKEQGHPPSVTHVLEMGSPAANVAYAKKCKKVDLLQTEISAAHAAIDATMLKPPRTRSQKGKATGKDLIKKIKDLAKKLKKKTPEHDALLQEIVLERKSFENTLKQTTASVDESIAEAVRRENEGRS